MRFLVGVGAKGPTAEINGIQPGAAQKFLPDENMPAGEICCIGHVRDAGRFPEGNDRAGIAYSGCRRAASTSKRPGNHSPEKRMPTSMCNMTVVNRSTDPQPVRVAIYKRPIVQNALGTIAWRIVSLPRDASLSICTGHQYEIEAQTRSVGQFEAGSAGFVDRTHRSFENSGIDCVVENDPQLRIVPRAIAAEAVNYGEVRVENRTRNEIWVTVMNDAMPLYWPFVVLPGQIRNEDLRQPFYFAIAPAEIAPGERLDDIELLPTQTPFVDGAIAVIRGNAAAHSIELFRNSGQDWRQRAC